MAATATRTRTKTKTKTLLYCSIVWVALACFASCFTGVPEQTTPRQPAGSAAPPERINVKVSVDAVDGSLLQYNFDVQSQVPAAILQAEIEKASGEPGQLTRPDGGSIDPKATLTQQGIVADSHLKFVPDNPPKSSVEQRREHGQPQAPIQVLCKIDESVKCEVKYQSKTHTIQVQGDQPASSIKTEIEARTGIAFPAKLTFRTGGDVDLEKSLAEQNIDDGADLLYTPLDAKLLGGTPGTIEFAERFKDYLQSNVDELEKTKEELQTAKETGDDAEVARLTEKRDDLIQITAHVAASYFPSSTRTTLTQDFYAQAHFVFYATRPDRDSYDDRSQ